MPLPGRGDPFPRRRCGPGLRARPLHGDDPLARRGGSWAGRRGTGAGCGGAAGRWRCRRKPEHGPESRDGSVGAIPGRVVGPGFTSAVRACWRARPGAWWRSARNGLLSVPGGTRRRSSRGGLLLIPGDTRRRSSRGGLLLITGGIRRTVAGNVRAAAAPGQPGRICGLLPVYARGPLLRQWRGRKRRDVGFRGGRDVFGEGPAAEERGIFVEGLIVVFRGVFRLCRASPRSRLDGFRCSRMAIGPHVRPATAAKLSSRGNGMPVTASPHRSPLSVPAVHHPPC